MKLGDYQILTSDRQVEEFQDVRLTQIRGGCLAIIDGNGKEVRRFRSGEWTGWNELSRTDGPAGRAITCTQRRLPTKESPLNSA